MSILKLPKRMEEVLLEVYGKGKRESDVARELGISKQAVSKFLREGRARLTEIFVEVAEMLHADIVRISLNKGYAVIRPRQLKIKAYIVYVPSIGPRILFGGNIVCEGEVRKLCREVVEAFESWGLLGKCSEETNDASIIECVIRTIEE